MLSIISSGNRGWCKFHSPYTRAAPDRERKKLKAAQYAADGVTTSAAAVHEPLDVNDVSDFATASEGRLDEMDMDFRRSVTMEEHSRSASDRFENTFVNNPFDHKCDVRDRLWFLRDLKPVKSKHMLLLHNMFPGEAVADFKLCSACRKSLDSNKVTILSRSTGFKNSPKPSGLPTLDPISARLI
jgi:hypothetical protein